MSYILRIDLERLIPGALGILEKHIYEVYPNWGKTQAFLREIRANSGYNKKHFSHSDVEDMLMQVADTYGRWQDKECHELKTKLLAMEDKTIGTNGSGRVRMTDFYDNALNRGNWQTVETTEYLELLGILDSHDPNIPRMIIPNYINSPSNCVAGSKYYSVCCINECEDLVDSLEHCFQAPAVSPRDVIDAVSSLPSSTVPASRELHPILINRLQDIAMHHGGRVPLHGRLFAQWMHHAYPRECPYPHMSGTVRAQRIDEFQKQSQQSPDFSMQQIPDIVEKHRAAQAQSVVGGSNECTTWSHLVELYVSGPASESSGFSRRFRPLAYLGVVAAVASVLVRQAAGGSKEFGALVGRSGGKDYFV